MPWLQAVDGLAAVVLVPPVLLLWRWQARRGKEPDDLLKIAVGCAIFAAGTVWLAVGHMVANAAGKVPLLWALAFHFTYNVGYVYVAPIAPALYSRSAPASINAMMVSVYYLSIFGGSILSGRLGGLYERLPPTRFWLIHAAIVAAGGLVIWLCAPRLRHELRLLPQAQTPNTPLRIGILIDAANFWRASVEGPIRGSAPCTRTSP